MTIDEIKAELKARGMSITDLAKQLDVTADGLGRILANKRPLTGQLARHISLLFKSHDIVIAHSINIPEARVEEICCNCTTEAERQAAIDALLHHNLLWLASIGAQLDWSDEEREYLGLPPA